MHHLSSWSLMGMRHAGASFCLTKPITMSLECMLLGSRCMPTVHHPHHLMGRTFVVLLPSLIYPFWSVAPFLSLACLCNCQYYSCYWSSRDDGSRWKPKGWISMVSQRVLSALTIYNYLQFLQNLKPQRLTNHRVMQASVATVCQGRHFLSRSVIFQVVTLRSMICLAAGGPRDSFASKSPLPRDSPLSGEKGKGCINTANVYNVYVWECITYSEVGYFWIYIYIHIHMHVCIYIYTYICVCVGVCYFSEVWYICSYLHVSIYVLCMLLLHIPLSK